MDKISTKFSSEKELFDKEYGNKEQFHAIVPVHLTFNKECKIKSKNGEKNEEYYKWQFISAIINAGMYNKDFIGVEVCLPKGNKNSAPIKFDAAIFKSNEWFKHYKVFHETNSQNELDWLRKNIICVIEFKNENSKNIEVVYNQQLKPAIKEIEGVYAIGILYDTSKLYLFRKKQEKVIRFDETLNKKGDESNTKELSLDIPDAYYKIPNFEQIIKNIDYMPIDRGNRTIYDLDIITGASTNQLKDCVSDILKVMDSQSMLNQRGYEILIQILALKIFDEKRCQELYVNEEENKKIDFYAQDYEIKKMDLLFYINDFEKDFIKISDEDIQAFIKRMRKLYNEASAKYHYILKENDEETITWGKEEHIHIIGEIVKQFQDYSFILSSQTDLYQLVFYQFASEFSKAKNGQFVTPIPVIEFLVNVVNPKRAQTDRPNH
jgi:type I restriction enzyme M protein